MNGHAGSRKARHLRRAAAPLAGLRWVGWLGFLAQAAWGVTSGDLPLARTFDKTTAPTNSSILVTATLTNTTSATLRGFCYYDEVPTGLTVTTVSVSLNGQPLSNFNVESGPVGDLVVGCTPRRWWLETPATFPEANPIPPQGVVQILFTLTCPTNGTFSLQQFGWVAGISSTTNTLYGYSSSADQQSLTFGSPPPPANAPPVLSVQSSQVVTQLATLLVTNTATDADGPSDLLSYLLFNPPAGAAIDTNGIISWTPSTSQVGLYTLTTVVTDSGSPPLSATNNFNVTVYTSTTPPPPSLPTLPDVTLNEGQSLTVTNTATTTRNASQWSTNSYLFNYANRAALISDGWSFNATRANGTTRPTESPDPAAPTAPSYDQLAHPGLLRIPSQWGDLWYTSNNSTNTLFRTPPTDWLSARLNLTFAPTANYSQVHLSLYQDDDNFVQTGLICNSYAGGLGATFDHEVGGNSTQVFTALAAGGNITFRLDRNPANNAITGFYSRDSTTWVTLGTTVPSLVNPRLAIWTGNGNTTPTTLPSLDLYRLEVVESNTAPVFLSYALINSPTNASISTNGLITWTPDEAQGPSTNVITTVVTDNGVPPASATNSFVVVVNELNQPPPLPAQSDCTLAGRQPLVLTNSASDADIPANGLSYAFLAAPTGADIDPNGIITWTPSATQVPSTNLFTTVVTDSNPWAINGQHLSATNSFTVVVSAVHIGPSLPVQTNLTMAELTLLVVTNTASDTDLPSLGLNYMLLNPPPGAAIDPNGLITWPPTETQGPGVYTLTTVVTDSGTPPLSATNSFQVTVNEVNTAPVLPAQADKSLAAMQPLVVTNTAIDADIPTNSLTYQLTAAPEGAAIDANGIITWTPTMPQVPSTNVFTAVVTDDNPWAVNQQSLSATNSFTVVVQPPPSAPTILSLNLSNGLAVLTWTASPGSTYRLEYTDSLGATNWLAVSPDITAGASTASTTDTPGSAPQRFYRVLRLAP